MSFESSLVWVEPGFLCFGEKPGRWRPLEEDLDFLRTNGIRAIVSLLEEEHNLGAYREAGFTATHIPVKDFLAPSQEQIDHCMQAVLEYRRTQLPVYLHCYGGLGRSGTMAAAWLIHGGQPALEAIRVIRRLKPGTIESDHQYNALLEYAARLHSSA